MSYNDRQKASEAMALLLVFTFSSEDDRDKFDFLYSRYKNLMLKKAYDILRDPMLAEDAVSEAFIRIYKNLHKIGDAADNRSISFVATVTKNVALTMLGKSKGQVSEPVEEAAEDPFNLEEHILTRLSSEGIYAMLNQLSEELRSVFLLKYAHDLSHREIGRLLHISENNVTVRLHRAKKKLGAFLVKEGYASGN